MFILQWNLLFLKLRHSNDYKRLFLIDNSIGIDDYITAMVRLVWIQMQDPNFVQNSVMILCERLTVYPSVYMVFFMWVATILHVCLFGKFQLPRVHNIAAMLPMQWVLVVEWLLNVWVLKLWRTSTESWERYQMLIGIFMLRWDVTSSLATKMWNQHHIMRFFQLSIDLAAGNSIDESLLSPVLERCNNSRGNNIIGATKYETFWEAYREVCIPKIVQKNVAILRQYMLELHTPFQILCS